MKESIMDMIFSTSGYLPPRNEEEMMAFEHVYSKVKIDKDFHVDVDSIVNGRCHYKPINHPSIGNSRSFQYNYRSAAARNFEGMSNDIIEKLREQHKDDND